MIKDQTSTVLTHKTFSFEGLLPIYDDIVKIEGKCLIKCCSIVAFVVKNMSTEKKKCASVFLVKLLAEDRLHASFKTWKNP